MSVFDSDGAPLSYEHLGWIAPQPDPEWLFTGRVYAEFDVVDFATTATHEDDLKNDLRAYFAKDADTLDFDMED